MAQSSSTDSQLQIKFVTKQQKYAVSDTPYYVPGNINTAGLNELLNELISENSEKSEKEKVQFDFVINDELLRCKLSEHLVANSIPTERDIVIEYIEAVPSPEPLDCLQHDDWVSAVHASDKWILSGCYDNSLHIWSAKGKHLVSGTVHSGPVKDVSWIGNSSSVATFVSVSQDQTALLWEWDIERNDMKNTCICRGHERSVNCVDARASQLVFVTGGWDSSVKVWSTDTSSFSNHEEEEIAAKRRKTKPDAIFTRIPKSSLKGHKEAISTVQWTDDDEVLSASWDHTLKIWDIEYGAIKTELVANKSIFHANHSALNGLILTCGADRYIRLYDPKSNEGSIVKKTFMSHKEWVQSVKWSNADPNLFVSGSYDNCLKLWDIRSCTTPLYDLLGHEDKVLCCDWSKPSVIISGSADSTLRLFGVKH